MHAKVRQLGWLGMILFAAATSGCFLFAAGAGAGGAIYVTDRGVESVVARPVGQTFDAARQAFQDLGITETKSSSEQEGEGGIEKRSLEGKTSDRDVQVELKTEGNGTKVSVVVKKTAVTWDKDFARRVVSKIVERSR